MHKHLETGYKLDSLCLGYKALGSRCGGFVLLLASIIAMLLTQSDSYHYCCHNHDCDHNPPRTLTVVIPLKTLMVATMT